MRTHPRLVMALARLSLSVLAVLIVVSTVPAEAQTTAASSPEVVARVLLDDRLDEKQRETLAREVAPRAAEIVGALVQGLPRNDADEEYRRIPWIWRVSVAAGRGRDEAALIDLLDVSMPRDDEPLRDWQAVVLGGGIVMGLSQAGTWPRDEMAPWLAGDPARAARWQRALDLAGRMADAADVRNGTRYDALRMLGVLPWAQGGPRLVRYLDASVDAELQAGAIGGLSDLQDERAGRALIEHAATYAPANRRGFINALLRTEERRQLLREAVRAGTVPLAWMTTEQQRQLQPGADTAPRANVAWPRGARMALSLSFDDGRESQVKVGLPFFKEQNVAVTFFVVPSAVERQRDLWRQAVVDGHEIGNHSLQHACSANFPWSRAKALEDYTAARMRQELSEASRRITELVGAEPTTFAYPCGQTFIGRGRSTESYVPIVADLFLAGRGWLDESANDPEVVDLAQLMGVEMDGKSFGELRPLLEDAAARGAWLVLAGHDIGGDARQTTRVSMLAELIAYARDPANGVWLARVDEVAQHLIRARE